MKVCAKKNVKNAKKISVSLRECGIVLGAGTNYCPPQQFLPSAISAAWCLSIVLLRYIRTQSTQYNFASLRIVEGSAGAVVAASEIKAVELDLFSTSNCFSSCFLHAPVGDPFYERYNPFNNYGSTE